MVYIKVPKTGSTTMANIVRRMSSRHGIKNVANSDKGTWISEEPGAWWSHSEYSVLKSKIDALHDPYYSFSLLRDPVTKAISYFQFFVMFCKCKCEGGWRDCPAENDFRTTQDGIEDLLSPNKYPAPRGDKPHPLISSGSDHNKSHMGPS